jgi:hypothetical protein
VVRLAAEHLRMQIRRWRGRCRAKNPRPGSEPPRLDQAVFSPLGVFHGDAAEALFLLI